MSKRLLGVKGLLVTLMVAVPVVALAGPHDGPGRPGGPGGPDSRDLDRRVFQLEQRMHEMDQMLFRLNARVEMLERGYQPPMPTPIPVEILNVCSLMDGFYSKTFVAVARTRMDAEFNAKKACEAVVNASFCGGSSAVMKCDDNRNVPPNQGFVCMITDGFYNKSYRGEGRTQVEAEALARISCQGSVNASFCAKVPAQCEVFFR